MVVSPALGAPAFVQVATNGGAAPLAVSFPGAVQPGDAVIVAVYYGGTSVTLSDSAGNAYAHVARVTGTAGLAGAACELFVAAGVDGGTPFDLRAVGPTAPFQVFAAEYSGLEAATPFDVAAVATSGSGGSTTADSGALVTALPDELLVAFAVSTGSIVGGAPGFTSRSSFNANLLADAVVSPGTWRAVATSSSADWFMILGAFRAAGSFDGGTADAGSTDGGVPDAGAPDGGSSDGGGSTDAGAPDGGASDGGERADAGPPDSGASDGGGSADARGPAGGLARPELQVGCGCSGTSVAPALVALALAAGRWRRRVTRSS